MNRRVFFAYFAFFSLVLTQATRAENPGVRASNSKISVNFRDTDIRQVFELIASQAGLQLQMDQDVSAVVTVNQANATAREILEKLSQDQQLSYSIRGDELIVTKRNITRGGSGSVHHLRLRFASAAEIGVKLQQIVPASEKLMIDEPSNSIVLVGSEETWRKVSAATGYLDIAPTQILIETQIVETTSQFMRKMGVSLGMQNRSGNQMITTSNPISESAPPLSYSGVFTNAAGAFLNVKLDAAVSSGEAKIVSRPKVLTLNNQHAKIESGVEIHVKTLSTAITNPLVPAQSTSTGTPGLSATTGITTLNAGLTLDILPSVVGSGMIRLTIKVNDSQPDNAATVDGIPNIQNNAASTSILVKNGETAVLAGLVKQSKGDATRGVPILSDIPLLGALFRSSSKAETSSELVIFITPKIDDGHVDTAAHRASVDSSP